MPLEPEELERYARHIVLRDVGGPGQQKLKRARVLIIGAGGLGAPLIQYLAAAGLGTIGLVDDDTVSLSNLQRQVIHDTDAIGMAKVESAARFVARMNPHVTMECHPTKITPENAVDLISRYDIVADGTDNFATRYAVSDGCFHAARPLVTAALGQFEGSLTTLKPHLMGADGKPNPTYRCLFPSEPPAGLLPTCAQAGVLGALPGILGSMQAMEIVKEIVGLGEGLVGKLVMVDAKSMRMDTIDYAWNPKNPLNGTAVKPLPAEAAGS